MKLYKGKIYEMVFDNSVIVQSTTTPANLIIPMLGRIINNAVQFNFTMVRTNWISSGNQQFYILNLILTRNNEPDLHIFNSLTFMVPSDVEISDDNIALTSGAITISDVTPSDFMMMFIHSNAETKRVNKQPYLEDGEIQTGTLRESSSLTNPRITFQYSAVPSFNYVYIPSFNRFYFVNGGFTFLSKNLWSMELSVDALMSFNYEIRTQKAYIDRQENIYSDELVDDEIDTHYAKGIEYQIITPTTQIFPVTQSEEDTRNSYLLTVVKQ